MQKTYNVIADHDAMRLDRWLRKNIDNLPQGLIEKFLRNGNIKVNKRKIKSSYKVREDDKISLFNVRIKKQNHILKILSFDVIHGMIKATGYIFDKVAYISDCNKIPPRSLKNLYNLDYLILDCLRRKKHPSHFNYDEALSLVKEIKPTPSIGKILSSRRIQRIRNYC